MAFNLLGYRDKYKDYYGNAPLEDIAKDAFQKGYHNGEGDYDTWKKASGIENVIQEDNRRRNPTIEDKLRTATSGVDPERNLVKSFLQGGAEGITTELPSMVGGAMEFAGSYLPGETIQKTGKSIKDWAEEKRLDWYGPDIERTGLDRIIYEGTKMLAPSLIPGGIVGTGMRAIKGVGALQKAGKFAEAAKAAGAANNIAAGSVAALFGLSQAQQTRDTANERADELERQGLTEEANSVRASGHGIAPIATGAIEALGEFLGTKYLGKLFGLDDAEIVKKGAKSFVVDLLKTLGVEVGTEMGQQAGEAAVEKYSGIRQNADPISEAIDVIGPTTFMTLLTGGLAGAANKFKSTDSREKQAAEYLENLKKGAMVSLAIDTGMKTGQYEGQPFTREDALQLMKIGNENGIYTTEDLDRFKDRYPQLRDGLNGVIAEDIIKKIDQEASPDIRPDSESELKKDMARVKKIIQARNTEEDVPVTLGEEEQVNETLQAPLKTETPVSQPGNVFSRMPDEALNQMAETGVKGAIEERKRRVTGAQQAPAVETSVSRLSNVAPEKIVEPGATSDDILNKKIYEVPFADLQGRFKKEDHREAVKQAITEGKEVPENVLSEYPELTKPNPEAKAGESSQEEPYGNILKDNFYHDVAKKYPDHLQAIKQAANELEYKGLIAFNDKRRTRGVVTKNDSTVPQLIARGIEGRAKQLIAQGHTRENALKEAYKETLSHEIIHTNQDLHGGKRKDLEAEARAKQYRAPLKSASDLQNATAEPSEIFIRPAERKDLGRVTKSLAKIPYKEGYEKVYKKEGSQGRGFYYVKLKEKIVKVNHEPKKETTAQNLAQFLIKAGKVRLGSFSSRTGTAWDRAHGMRGKDESRELGVIKAVASQNGKMSMDEAADYVNAEGFRDREGKPFNDVTLFNELAYGDSRNVLHPSIQESKIDKEIERQENEWIAEQLANLEAEGIDAGRIAESSESVSADIISEIAAEGYSSEQIEENAAELDDFFASVSAAAKKQSPEPATKKPVNAEKDQIEIPGASYAETWNLTNPETDMSKHKELSQQVTPKNEDLFREEKKSEPDLSAKSTQELVGDIFNIINDHIGKRGSLSNKPIDLDESLYQKLKPFLAEIIKRAKAKALDARAYLFGAVDSMPEGKAKELYEAAARRISDEDDNVHYEKQVINKKDSTPYSKIAEAVSEKLYNKTKFTRNELFEMSSEAFGGTLAEGKFSAKDAYDAMEMGINQRITEIGADPRVPHQYFVMKQIEKLKGMCDLIPTQTTRTAEMDEFQQFSTPPALAYVANWVANLNENDIYAEPSAGTGNIAIFAKIAEVKETIVNELAPRRAAILKEMGFDRVFTENAEQINNILPADIRPTVVVMNPPFSSTAGRMKGERKTSNATVHIEQCLKRLVPGGRLVAIVGEGMAADRPTFKPWFNKLAKDYIIRANIGISGQEYVKYGTSFGNQILVIDKPISPAGIDNTDNGSIIEVTGRVDKIEQLIDLLEGVRSERINIGEQRPAEQGKQESPARTESNTGRNEPLQPAAGSMVAGEQSGRPGRTVNDNTGRNEGVESPQGAVVPVSKSGNKGSRGSGTVGQGKGKSGRTGGPNTPDDTRQTDYALAELPAEAIKSLEVEQRAEIEKRSDELSDSVYDTYRPAKLTIPGAKDHPGKLVESAAMASVEPIDPNYQPKLPEQAVKAGKISIAQLEAVVYAGQAHQEILPSGERKGFFIGDGTGVGKGREIASILWDNWNHGRKKAVWLSQNSPLMKDAERDIKGIGWNPKLLFDIGKTKLQSSIQPKEGIGFVGYGTLRSKKVAEGKETSRLNQIAEWLGKDFDGCIIFDESHNMGNALASKGSRGTSKPSATALAGVELQKILPNARVVYVSATGATEVMNLAYASRLGLWGDKTPFPNALSFVSSISSGGITAMEMVAMNMKANGVYMARSLAYDDVKYERLEHDLSKEQREIYDELASAWQVAQRDIDAAMVATNVVDEHTGATLNTDAKSHIMAQFWGTNQRFWNQVITAMQMPTVVKAIEKDVKSGYSPIIQLINTNEAAQERAIGRLEEEDTLEDLDITPKEMLMEYVKNSFPVYQFEKYTDDEGHEKSRLVKDSEGNPVINPEAVQKREDLLMKIGSIRVPDGPLEMVLDHFGADNVAEVTGRSRRVIYKNTPEGRQRVIESWGKNKGMADADAFMDDRKKMLIFSQAGGTGRSYHADKTAKNKRLRRHYLVQAGWRADVAVQGLGRSHRTNQEQAPEWVLVTTDLEGQKRFISSIARRLSQLGALTKGSRETGNQGLFNARDNLESQEAKDAFHQLLHDLYHNIVDGITMGEFIEDTGMNNILDKETGALNVSQLPDITQFLNRILNMRIERQNTIFGEFAKRLNMKVAKAIEDGTLDVGVETIRAKKTEKVGESVVYEDPKTKAKATYIEVELTHDAKLLTYDESHQFSRQGYVQNIKSGRVWALAGIKSKTDAHTGNISNNYAAVGANYNYHDILEEDINNDEKYKRLSPSEAEILWNKDYDAAPKEVRERVHLITGTILPIWDRLPSGMAKIYRLQVDGKNMIGRVIDRKSLEGTLNKLGAQRKAQQFVTADVFDNILQRNHIYTLSNDWTLQRRKVADDYRIEIKGPNYSNINELGKYGVFTERINYDTRFFIPTDKEKGINAINEIISSRPIVDEAGGAVRKAGAVSTSDAAFMNKIDQYSVGKKQFVVMPTIADVQQVFKGQEVTEVDSGFAIKTRGGQDLIIKSVDHISPNRMALNIGYGQNALKDGSVVAGKYLNGTIELTKGAADKWTLNHESVHFMEDVGVLNSNEINLLQRHIKNLVGEGKFKTANQKDIGGAEDRANFLADALTKEPKGLLGRIINKIQNFIDKLVNAFGIRTVKGIQRDIKSGEIFNKRTDGKFIHGEQYSIRHDPPISKDPKVLNLYLKDETDALVQTIKNKLHPQHMTFLETVLKSPEWFSNSQLKNIVRLFMRDRNEIYHETFNDLNMTDDINAPESTVTEAAKSLKRKGLSLADRIAGKVSPEYERLQQILDEGDTAWKRNKSIPLEDQLKNFENHIRQQGATEDTIRVWKLYRQSYDKALDLQTAQLQKMIEELTEEANFKGEKPDLNELKQTLKGALAQMEEWRGFYAPRIRQQGNWKVQAYKEHGPMTGNREWYREHRGSELTARRLANKLQREGWTIYNVGEVERIPESIYQDVNAVATAKLIDQALEKLSKKSELTNELTTKFNEEVLRSVSDAIKARGFRSTMIHRGKGGVVRGFIEDPIQRHLQYINSLSGGIAKARVARMAMKELLGEKVDGKQVGGIDPVKDPRAFQVAQNYVEEQLRNTEPIDRIIGLAKSIATFKFLGFNLRSLAVNTTAIVTTAPAAIHQYALGGKGSLTEIMRELAKAGKDYGVLMAGRKLQNRDEQAFLDEVHKKGWDDAQYTREALGGISKTHSRVWSTMMDGSMYLFGKSEKWNRGTTMLAAYRMARKQEMDHGRAAEAAKEASDKAHGVYGKSTMPMWAQGTNPAAKIGQMVYVYQKFGHNYLQMLYDMGLKNHNIKGAMFAFLSPLVLAGGAALPFKDMLFGIAGVILGALGVDKDPEKWVWDEIRQHVSPEAEKIGRHGLTGALGVDISSSLSAGVGIPKNFIDLTGAIGGLATEIKEAGESIGSRQYRKAAEHLLPSGIANPIRAFRESEQGVSTRNNRRVWDESGKPYIPGAGATAARAIGFRSTDQAVLSERTWEGHRQQAEFSERRNDIYEKYRAWILGGRDREEYKKIVKEVQDYNRSIRGIPGVSPITSQNLRSQIRRMQRPSKNERAILQS